jgi:hypothetical protein
MPRFRSIKFSEMDDRIDWKQTEPIVVDDELVAFKCGLFRFAFGPKGFVITEEFKREGEEK